MVRVCDKSGAPLCISVLAGLDDRNEILTTPAADPYRCEVQAMEACSLEGAAPAVTLEDSRNFLRKHARSLRIGTHRPGGTSVKWYAHNKAVFKAPFERNRICIFVSPLQRTLLYGAGVSAHVAEVPYHFARVGGSVTGRAGD